MRGASALGAGEVYLEFVDAFYAEWTWRLKEVEAFRRKPIAPDAQLWRVAVETGFGKVDPATGRYWRSIGVEPGDSGPYNPLGIKKADTEIRRIAEVSLASSTLGVTLMRHEILDAEGLVTVEIVEDDAPKMFERPPTARAGAHLGYNHTGAYFGLDAVDPVNSRYPLARQVGDQWRADHGRYPEQFGDWGNAGRGGVWATDPNYARAIQDVQARFAQAIADGSRGQFTGRGR